jgi:hypothetical protein
MPYLGCYLAGDDEKIILNFLNESDEIAFVVPAGRVRRWKTVSTIPELSHGEQSLWHKPGGPLPLFQGAFDPAESILDPENGFWSQSVDRPTFGGSDTNVIFLHFRPVIVDKVTGEITLNVSDFSWVGNYFSISGHPAPAATEKWWKQLRRFVKKHAIKVKRECYPDGAFAFPDAQRLIAKGVKRL